MEYASPVMKPRKAMDTDFTENCSKNSESCVNKVDFDVKIKRTGNHHSNNHNDNNLQTDQSQSSDSLNDWSPEATFWISLIFIILFATFLAIYCILKQRKEDIKLTNRSRKGTRKNWRFRYANNREISRTSSKSNSRESSYCIGTSTTRTTGVESGGELGVGGDVTATLPPPPPPPSAAV